MMCKFAVSIIQSMLEDHKENIKDAMKKLCGLLPGSIADQCTSMVDTYITIMINMVTKGATPEMICKTILLCNPIIKHPDRMRGMGLPAREWADWSGNGVDGEVTRRGMDSIHAKEWADWNAG